MFRNRDDLIDGADSRWLSELVDRIKPTIDTTPRPQHKQKLKEEALAVFDEALADDIRKFEELAARPLPVQPSPQHKRQLKEKVLAVFDETAADDIRQAQQRRLRRRRLRFAIAGAARSRTFKVAAAAVLICGFGAWLAGIVMAGTAFADVLKEIRKASTVTYTQVVEFAEGPTAEMKVMRASEGSMRLIYDDGEIQVSDVKQDKIMTLDPTDKTARIVDYRFAKGKVSPDDFIQAFMGLAEDSGKFDSQGTIDGRTANIFRIEQQSQRMTVWTDPETNLPIRIEAISLAQKDKPIPVSQAKWVFSDFVWGSQLDESLFQAVVPDKYKVSEDPSTLPASTEQDLVAMLRCLAKLSEEDIPSQFNLNTVPKLLASLDGRMLAQLTVGGCITIMIDPVPLRTGANTPQEKELARDEQRSTLRGISFIWEKLTSGVDVDFSKASLRSGNSRIPVCWWKPKGSARYRAVYGDFTVRDLEGHLQPSVP